MCAASLRRDAEFKTAEGEKFSRATLKTDKYWEHDCNWYNLARNRDVRKKLVVEKAKVHYNYKNPELTLPPETPASPTSSAPPPTPPAPRKKETGDIWITTDQTELRTKLLAEALMRLPPS